MKKHFFSIFRLLLITSYLSCSLSLFAFIDLERNTQSFVLETKQIHIPGYPDAFNPSIIRWKGSLLLSFRVLPNLLSKFDSWIGLIWLDENFNAIGKPCLFNANDERYRSEDARLIMSGDRLWMVYSDNKDQTITRGGFRVYVSEIIHQNNQFLLQQTECLTHFEGANKEKREKNWSPFDYKGHLLLAYSLTPHQIFRPLLAGTGKCETFCCSKADIAWDWGELRGGTPGLLDNGQYLAFFHSSKDMISIHSNGKTTAHYFMGAYTFRSYPPFEITGISPEPIVGKGFYESEIYKPYWKPVNVVFPGGFIFDEKFIWVVYGKQDHEAWIVKMDKQKLLKSLSPVSTSRSGK